jgi:hypothetical protein
VTGVSELAAKGRDFPISKNTLQEDGYAKNRQEIACKKDTNMK